MASDRVTSTASGDEYLKTLRPRISAAVSSTTMPSSSAMPTASTRSIASTARPYQPISRRIARSDRPGSRVHLIASTFS
jgi:hypothetical protein